MPGGRPRKYQTEEEAKTVKRQNDTARQREKREQERLARAHVPLEAPPLQILFYSPSPPDIPVPTDPNLGLRVDPQLSIPKTANFKPNESAIPRISVIQQGAVPKATEYDIVPDPLPLPLPPVQEGFATREPPAIRPLLGTWRELDQYNESHWEWARSAAPPSWSLSQAQWYPDAGFITRLTQQEEINDSHDLADDTAAGEQLQREALQQEEVSKDLPNAATSTATATPSAAQQSRPKSLITLSHNKAEPYPDPRKSRDNSRDLYSATPPQTPRFLQRNKNENNLKSERLDSEDLYVATPNQRPADTATAATVQSPISPPGLDSLYNTFLFEDNVDNWFEVEPASVAATTPIRRKSTTSGSDRIAVATATQKNEDRPTLPTLVTTQQIATQRSQGIVALTQSLLPNPLQRQPRVPNGGGPAGDVPQRRTSDKTVHRKQKRMSMPLPLPFTSEDAQSLSPTPLPEPTPLPAAVRRGWPQQEHSNTFPSLRRRSSPRPLPPRRSRRSAPKRTLPRAKTGDERWARHAHTPPPHEDGSDAEDHLTSDKETDEEDEARWEPVAVAGEPPAPMWVKLARQLWCFKGCKSHSALDAIHAKQHPNSGSPEENCHSLLGLLQFLTGDVIDSNDKDYEPVPNILGQATRIMQRGEYGSLQQVDWSAMFEGVSRHFDATAAPANLCLSHWHSRSLNSLRPQFGFDIDSTLAFIKSPAVAKRGLSIYLTLYPKLMLSTDIHLGLQIHYFEVDKDSFQETGRQLSKWAPLYQIYHYVLGRVIGMRSMQMTIFFPWMSLGIGLPDVGGSGSGSGSGSSKLPVMPREKETMLVDEILIPALQRVYEARGSAKQWQYKTKSHRTAIANARAKAVESYATGTHSEMSYHTHDITSDQLDDFWNEVLSIIRLDNCFRIFSHPVLFIDSKNDKELIVSDKGLVEAFTLFERHWDTAIDEDYLDHNQVYIDLAKDTISRDFGSGRRTDGSEKTAETYIPRKCCLDMEYKYFTDEEAYNAADIATTAGADPLSDEEVVVEGEEPIGATAHGIPEPGTSVTATATATATATLKDNRQVNGFRRSYYPFATMRDAGCHTITTSHACKGRKDGVIHRQVYSPVKRPFDAEKNFIFDHNHFETAALDPAYTATLQYAGGVANFNPKVVLGGIGSTKGRAYMNIQDNDRDSYSMREETRITLRTGRKIDRLFRVWTRRSDTPEQPLALPLPSPLPFFIFQTKTLFDFFFAQLNKYILLFEFVLSNANKTHSHPEMAIMVLALRALRFCYGSSFIQKEYLLWRHRWEKALPGRQWPVVYEGMGMGDLMRTTGFGWIMQGKIDWQTTRFFSDTLRHVMAGNMLVTTAYKKRWRAAKDVRDASFTLQQIDDMYQAHEIGHAHEFRWQRQRQWLELLMCHVIATFDQDIWMHVQHADKAHPELTRWRYDPVATGNLDKLTATPWCRSSMKPLFQHTIYITDQDDPNISFLRIQPGFHVANSNKTKFKSPAALLRCLFDPHRSDEYKRGAWHKMVYRKIYHEASSYVERRLGREAAEQWQRDLTHVLLATHWILPYTNVTSFLPLTKTNQSENQVGCMSWYTSFFDGEKGFYSKKSFYRLLCDWRVERWQCENEGKPLPVPLDLETLQSREMFNNTYSNEWRIDDLLNRLNQEGYTHSVALIKTMWGHLPPKPTLGQKARPVWQRGLAPQLEIVTKLRGCSIDEIHALFSTMLRPYESDVGNPGVGSGSDSGSGSDRRLRRLASALQDHLDEDEMDLDDNEIGPHKRPQLQTCLRGGRGSSLGASEEMETTLPLPRVVERLHHPFYQETYDDDTPLPSPLLLRSSGEFFEEEKTDEDEPAAQPLRPLPQRNINRRRDRLAWERRRAQGRQWRRLIDSDSLLRRELGRLNLLPTHTSSGIITSGSGSGSGSGTGIGIGIDEDGNEGGE